MTFDGQVRGTLACAAGVCDMELDIRASSQRGARLRGHEGLTFDRGSGTVLSFRPSDDVIITIGQ